MMHSSLSVVFGICKKDDLPTGWAEETTHVIFLGELLGKYPYFTCIQIIAKQLNRVTIQRTVITESE